MPLEEVLDEVLEEIHARVCNCYGLTSLSLEEALEEMLDKQESTTVMGKQGGI